MLVRPATVLPAMLLLLAGCGEAGLRAGYEWEKACTGDIGTHIARTVRDVDGIVFEGTKRLRVQTQYRNDLTVHSTIPEAHLFDMRRKGYRYVEFSVPATGAYDRSGLRLNFPPGHYRISDEDIGHPGCDNPGSIPRAAARRCLVMAPVDGFTARYRFVHAQAVASYDSGIVTSDLYRVVDGRTGETIATHARHSLGWHEGGFPMLIVGKTYRTKSCPEDGPAFDVHSVLQPAASPPA